MKKLLKLSHINHSGRHRKHEHTSYLPLVLLLLFTSFILVIADVQAQTGSPPPQSESVGLSGAVAGPPPSTAAVITNPTNGQRFEQSPVPVSGTCPPNVLVEILKNNIFGGSTFCTAEGTFEVSVDLLLQGNDLIARVYNELNQPGPNSDTVTVFYDLVPPQSSSLQLFEFNSDRLILSTDLVFRGTFANEQLSVPIEIIGGTPPYAVEIEWGDGNSDIVPRDNNQPFTALHTYQRPGTFQITLKATDAEGRVAFLVVAAVINGQPPELADEEDADELSLEEQIARQLEVMWPLTAATTTTVISFWLGERREKKILSEKYPEIIED
jgi:hypothetical protein